MESGRLTPSCLDQCNMTERLFGQVFLDSLALRRPALSYIDASLSGGLNQIACARACACACVRARAAVCVCMHVCVKGSSWSQSRKVKKDVGVCHLLFQVVPANMQRAPRCGGVLYMCTCSHRLKVPYFSS